MQEQSTTALGSRSVEERSHQLAGLAVKIPKKRE